MIAKQKNFVVANINFIRLKISIAQRDILEVDNMRLPKKEKKKRIKIVLGTKDDGLSQFGIANKVNKNHAGTSQQKEDKEIDLEGK